MVHVFIVGSKGIPANYGGFETFVENLVKGKQSNEIQYHVSCMDNEEKTFEYCGAECFGVRLPAPGAPGRILHMGLVLEYVEKWKLAHITERTIVYILGCRVGPLLYKYAPRLKMLGVQIFCNPDGLEWRRAKWNAAAKKFLHFCEASLIKNSDLAICDSKAIEQYVKATYSEKSPATTYIAYGTHPSLSVCPKKQYEEWCKDHETSEGQYFLIVGRFVPENNYETMIREFMKSNTTKKLIIITNVEKNKFYNQLLESTGMNADPRIHFAGTVYDQELLKKIREGAFAYLHGHEVGGTNPSLLEALGSTNLNLLLGVPFNREVAEDSALYWTKQESGSLALHNVIKAAEELSPEEIEVYKKRARDIIKTRFQWKDIIQQYEEVFLHWTKK